MGRTEVTFFLACLFIGDSKGQPTEKECCLTKNVGDTEYIYVSKGKVPPTCKTGCIYSRKDDTVSKYCFAAGELPVTCGDTTSGTIETCSCELNVTDSPNRIIGGDDVVVPKWQVALRSMFLDDEGKAADFTFCGGSLVTTRVVVTAAHCMFYKDSTTRRTDDSFRVWIGMWDITKTDGVLIRNVFLSELYTGYDVELLLENDIALLTLYPEKTTPNPLLPYLICLPLDKNYQYPDDFASTTGWGSINDANMSPTKLQGVSGLKTLSYAACNKLMIIEKTQICYADVKGKGTCTGDSGGPLVCTTQNEDQVLRHYLIGVTSYGAPVCTEKNPSVFTRVTEYLDWFNDPIKMRMKGEKPKWCGRTSSKCIDSKICC